MIRFLLISLLALAPALADGTRSAREGNRAYRDGDYEAAAEAYRRAIEDNRASDAARYAVRHNLGAALYRLGRTDEAIDQFETAGSAAVSPDDRARASFNAGNAALAANDFETAADFFREALRHDPAHEDARFNYEYARRQQPPESESDQGMTGDDDTGDGESDDAEPEESPDGDDQGEQTTPDEGEDSEESVTPQPQDSPEEGGQTGDPQDSGQPSQELTREQAEQILGALQQGEERLLREIQKAPYRARNVEKDW